MQLATSAQKYENIIETNDSEEYASDNEKENKRNNVLKVQRWVNVQLSSGITVDQFFSVFKCKGDTAW